MAPEGRNSLRDLVALQDRMNRLFEESLRSQAAGTEVYTGSWTPAVDVFETADALVLKLDLPEVPRQDVEIRLENYVLNISGKRNPPENLDQNHYHQIERPHGNFSRSFTLPGNVNQDEIKASCHDGVLTIRVSKKRESRSRQIQID